MKIEESAQDSGAQMREGVLSLSVNEESIAFRSDASCVKVVARLLIGRLVMILFCAWLHEFSAFEAPP
jgi:hypothetical protein